MPDDTPPPAEWPVEQRRAALEVRVQQLFAYGWVAEQVSDTTATLVRGKPVNHILHLLLTVFTCGLWAVVWLILALGGGQKRIQAHVDPWGRVTP